MNRLFGLPAHPLLVHVPVVLLPMAALGALAIALRPAWRRRYGWLVLGVTLVGTVGAVLAANAGDSLEETVGRSASVRDHADAGEMARNISLLFAVLVAAFVVGAWFLDRRRTSTVGAAGVPAAPRWVVPTLATLMVLGAAGSMYSIVKAGHSGARATWEDKGNPPPPGAGSRP
ncbi:MAG: hypothetical protein JWL70_2412 [Acidimicrobiia bacterium]|nr:hypothetical protein [Acidimicrobiia bacterium]